RPASTAMGIRRLLPGGTHIEVDQIALLPEAGEKRESVPLPPDVPQPVAKYSPALRAGEYVFLAGDLPTDFRGDFGQDKNWGDPGDADRERDDAARRRFGADDRADRGLGRAGARAARAAGCPGRRPALSLDPDAGRREGPDPEGAPAPPELPLLRPAAEAADA